MADGWGMIGDGRAVDVYRLRQDRMNWALGGIGRGVGLGDKRKIQKEVY